MGIKSERSDCDVDLDGRSNPAWPRPHRRDMLFPSPHQVRSTSPRLHHVDAEILRQVYERITLVVNLWKCCRGR